MKKVFLFAALVLACTAGSNASAMNEAALNASNSELMPVKKSTKKTTKKSTKKTTKKTSSKKTTAKKSTASASTASAAPTTSSAAATNTTANNTSATVNSAATVAGVLGAILGGSNAGNGSNSSSNAGSIINGILNNVIGSGTFKQADLCHTWKYSKPGCAFTSENLLAKAGGEIAASKIEENLSKYYNKFGFSHSNTYFTFKTDGTFAAKIDGKAWNGTYTFDEKTHAIQLKGLLLSASGFATRTTNGISLLFEQKKLLTLVKTLSKLNLTGSTTMSAVSSIVDNYDGVRMGFEMTK